MLDAAKRKILPAAWCLAGACALSSCLSPQADLTKVQRDSRFPDVAAPVGFRLEGSLVAASESPAHREFILRYVGRADRAKLEDFVREQYSIGGWRLECSQTLGERTYLDFRRGRERCSVLIEQHRFSVSLTIRVYETSA